MSLPPLTDVCGKHVALPSRLIGEMVTRILSVRMRMDARA
jgi:hypothetical protein